MKSSWTLSPQKFLNPQEVQSIRKTALERSALHESQGKRQAIVDWMILDLGLSAGLRVAEIQNLKIKDCFVGYDQNHVFVSNGKGKKQRTVIIDGKLVKHIKDFLKWKELWQEPNSPDSYLLVSERKNPYSRRGLQKRFKRLAKLSGISLRYSIHATRHTFGCELYRRTKNLRLVQKQMGHSSPAITQVYADLMDSEIADGMTGIYE